eukprot:Nk52_evm5s153 gene=Nk52_evmTU5s153
MPSVNKSEALGILGLAPSASDAQIQRAYKRLALRFHPDRNNNDEHIEKFRAVSSAYRELVKGSALDSYTADSGDSLWHRVKQTETNSHQSSSLAHLNEEEMFFSVCSRALGNDFRRYDLQKTGSGACESTSDRVNGSYYRQQDSCDGTLKCSCNSGLLENSSNYCFRKSTGTGKAGGAFDYTEYVDIDNDEELGEYDIQPTFLECEEDYRQFEEIVRGRLKKKKSMPDWVKSVYTSRYVPSSLRHCQRKHSFDTSPEPVACAIREGKLGELSSLIQSHTEACQSMEYNNTPLHFTARFGKLDCAEFLLMRGAMDCMGKKNLFGDTPCDVANLFSTAETQKYFNSKANLFAEACSAALLEEIDEEEQKAKSKSEKKRAKKQKQKKKKNRKSKQQMSSISENDETNALLSATEHGFLETSLKAGDISKETCSEHEADDCEDDHGLDSVGYKGVFSLLEGSDAERNDNHNDTSSHRNVVTGGMVGLPDSTSTLAFDQRKSFSNEQIVNNTKISSQKTSYEMTAKSVSPVESSKHFTLATSTVHCRYFARGMCREGINCRFVHEKPSTDASHCEVSHGVAAQAGVVEKVNVESKNIQIVESSTKMTWSSIVSKSEESSLKSKESPASARVYADAISKPGPKRIGFQRSQLLRHSTSTAEQRLPASDSTISNANQHLNRSASLDCGISSLSIGDVKACDIRPGVQMDHFSSVADASCSKGVPVGQELIERDHLTEANTTFSYERKSEVIDKLPFQGKSLVDVEHTSLPSLCGAMNAEDNSWETLQPIVNKEVPSLFSDAMNPFGRIRTDSCSSISDSFSKGFEESGKPFHTGGSCSTFFSNFPEDLDREQLLLEQQRAISEDIRTYEEPPVCERDAPFTSQESHFSNSISTSRQQRGDISDASCYFTHHQLHYRFEKTDLHQNVSQSSSKVNANRSYDNPLNFCYNPTQHTEPVLTQNTYPSHEHP